MATYQVQSLEEADLIIKQHERKTKTNYVLLRSTKNFGCIDSPAFTNEEYEVRFDTVGVPYCGVPFFVAGLKILQCQSIATKLGRAPTKRKEIKIELTGSGASVIGAADSLPGDDVSRPQPPRKKKKLSGGHGARASCTATVIMKEVIYYPEFQLYEHSKANRMGVARQLKEVLRSKTAVQKDRVIYVTVPANSDHFGHPVGPAGAIKVVTTKPAKRMYLKNAAYYGPTQDSSSKEISPSTNTSSPAKRVYFPIKEEKSKEHPSSFIVGLASDMFRDKQDIKTNRSITSGVGKGDKDMDTKIREVRESLQSIMAFTYKPGNVNALQELHEDLIDAKSRYMANLSNSSAYPVTPKKRVEPQQVTIQQTATLPLSSHPTVVPRQIIQQPQQQILFVKPAVPVSGARSVVTPQHIKPTTARVGPVVQMVEQDPSTLSITINAIPTGSVTPIAAAPALQSSALTSLQVSGMSAIPVASLPTVSLPVGSSLASLTALPTIPITSMPSFSTVVVPSALPSSVTLTIPAGSLSSLPPGTITNYQPNVLSQFSARPIAPACMVSTTQSFPLGVPLTTIAAAGTISSIHPGTLTSIHTANLPTIQSGILPTFQASSLASIITSSLPTIQTVASNSSSTLSSIASAANRSTNSALITSSSNSNTNKRAGRNNISSASSTQCSINSTQSLGSSNCVYHVTNAAGTSLHTQATVTQGVSVAAGSNGQMRGVQQHQILLPQQDCSSQLTGKHSNNLSSGHQHIVVQTQQGGGVSINQSQANNFASNSVSNGINTNLHSNANVVINSSCSNVVSSNHSNNISVVSSNNARGTVAISPATSMGNCSSSGNTSTTVTDANTASNNSQETTIFIEAMEAILNSHI